MTIYFDDGVTVIRSMLPGDAKILYDTYASYGWHEVVMLTRVPGSTHPQRLHSVCCCSTMLSLKN